MSEAGRAGCVCLAEDSETGEGNRHCPGEYSPHLLFMVLSAEQKPVNHGLPAQEPSASSEPGDSIVQLGDQQGCKHGTTCQQETCSSSLFLCVFFLSDLFRCSWWAITFTQLCVKFNFIVSKFTLSCATTTMIQFLEHFPWPPKIPVPTCIQPCASTLGAPGNHSLCFLSLYICCMTFI